jgi:hypothetical protein
MAGRNSADTRNVRRSHEIVAPLVVLHRLAADEKFSGAFRTQAAPPQTMD